MSNAMHLAPSGCETNSASMLLFLVGKRIGGAETLHESDSRHSRQ
jgi:hypothetical protein